MALIRAFTCPLCLVCNPDANTADSDMEETFLKSMEMFCSNLKALWIFKAHLYLYLNVYLHTTSHWKDEKRPIGTKWDREHNRSMMKDLEREKTVTIRTRGRVKGAHPATVQSVHIFYILKKTMCDTLSFTNKNIYFTI